MNMQEALENGGVCFFCFKEAERETCERTWTVFLLPDDFYEKWPQFRALSGRGFIMCDDCSKRSKNGDLAFVLKAMIDYAKSRMIATTN